MAVNRLTWLSLLCAGLGALVWLDHRSASKRPAETALPAPAIRAETQAAPAPPARSSAVRPAPGGGGRSAREIGNPLATLNKAALTDMVERPLFNSSRRRPPPVQIPPAAVAAKPAPPSYSLLGVVRDGERAVALLRKISDGASLRVSVGDTVGGWRVSKVDSKYVLLKREDGAEQLVSMVSE